MVSLWSSLILFPRSSPSSIAFLYNISFSSHHIKGIWGGSRRFWFQFWSQLINKITMKMQVRILSHLLVIVISVSRTGSNKFVQLQYCMYSTKCNLQVIQYLITCVICTRYSDNYLQYYMYSIIQYHLNTVLCNDYYTHTFNSNRFQYRSNNILYNDYFASIIQIQVQASLEISKNYRHKCK